MLPFSALCLFLLLLGIFDGRPLTNSELYARFERMEDQIEFLEDSLYEF